jgi:hypothetical protein
MRDKRLSIEARGLLAMLMTYADDWQFNRDHLMEMVGMGKDRFGRVMGELITFGYVERVYTRDEAGQLLGKSWVIRDDATDVRETRTMDATDVRENRRPGKPMSGKSAPIRIPTDQENQSSEENQDLFGSIEPQKENAREPEKFTDDGFDRFWSVYPKKAGKAEAQRAWRKAITQAPAETIIAAAKRYADWLNGGRPGEFRPQAKHAQGWLNGQRWTDPDIAPQPARRFQPPVHEEVFR